jgi:hypothetical protein
MGALRHCIERTKKRPLAQTSGRFCFSAVPFKPAKVTSLFRQPVQPQERTQRVV